MVLKILLVDKGKLKKEQLQEEKERNDLAKLHADINRLNEKYFSFLDFGKWL